MLYRERIPFWQYVVFVLLLIAWSYTAYFLLAPVDGFLRNHVFFWVPQGFIQPDFTHVSQPALIITIACLIIFNGIAAPIVEELYFRGYLLPRLSRLKSRASALELLLFTIYRF